MTNAPAKFEVATHNSLAEDLQESTLYDLDLGVKVTQMLPSSIYIMWPMHLGTLKLLCPIVQEKMHLQENILFELDPKVKVTWSVA